MPIARGVVVETVLVVGRGVQEGGTQKRAVGLWVG